MLVILTAAIDALIRTFGNTSPNNSYGTETKTPDSGFFTTRF
jgi:hypothetical protein